ncbi:MAG: double-cubane-cluster-containing anaerobic reductase [Elusimicrobiota bacterium]|nr:double-cubane-cluster-containing anaerobic reductase [Elusimicrobiota bacterium]
MKPNFWIKICSKCFLCKYVRTSKDKTKLKYKVFNKIKLFCPICRAANYSLKKIETTHKIDFEQRYKIEIIKKTDINVVQNIKETNKKILQLLHKNHNRPSTISYYEEILTSSLRLDELKETKRNGKKIIGTFCIFVPEELIYACGAIPVRLCAGSYDTISYAEEVLPRDICPLIKSSFGFKILGLSYFELCDLVIIPTTCDGKKKLAEILNDMMPVWILELPNRKNLTKAKTFWLEEIRTLKEKLEKFTKIKITKENLKQAIKLLHQRQMIFRKLYQLKKTYPLLLNERDTLLIIQASFYDDIKRWIEKTNQLYNEVYSLTLDSKHLNSKFSTQNITTQPIKLLLTGAPIIWPNYKILNIIETTQATIVADELCSGVRSLYDTTEVDDWSTEGCLRALAYKYLLPSTCPCFTESNDRIDKLLQSIKDFSVDAVIYHSLRLCQLYDIEFYKIKTVLKNYGIPILKLHTDYSPEDTEQLKTRIEAFIEMLETKTN